MYSEIIINYYVDTITNGFNQIVLINDGVIEYAGPFELKYHAEYLNLDITRFEAIN